MNKELKQFVADIENPKKREDTKILIDEMERASGFKPYLTGSIIGFGRYQYKYESGREGESLVTGFSPRKQNIAIYIMPGFSNYQNYLDKLGKYKTGKSCLYINKLADVELTALRHIVSRSVKDMIKKYPCRDN